MYKFQIALVKERVGVCVCVKEYSTVCKGVHACKRERHAHKHTEGEKDVHEMITFA